MSRLSLRIATAIAVAASALLPAASRAEGLTAIVATAGDHVAINPVTNKIYLGSPGFAGGTGVYVVDGQSYITPTIATGRRAGNLVVNALTNKIYVANGNPYPLPGPPGSGYGNDVTVIDGATNAFTNIVTGANPCGIAVNAATNKIYVANSDANQVTVIDGATNATTQVTVGVSPCAVAVNEATNTIFVANRGAGSNTPGTVSVIDGATDTVAATVSVGTVPTAIAVNPVTNRAYVAAYYGSNVTVIDGATRAATATIPTTEPFPVAIMANPATNRIYVANEGYIPGATCCLLTVGGITVIDGATNATTAVSGGGSNPRGLALDEVTNTIYVQQGDRWSGIIAIDGNTNVSRNLPGPPHGTGGVAVNPVTNTVYATNSIDGGLYVLDANTNAVTGLALGGQGYALAVNPVTGKAYFCVSGSGSFMQVVDGATNAITTIPYGCEKLAINAATNRIYAKYQNTVFVYDGATNAQITGHSIAYGGDMVVNEVTNRLYIGTSFGGNIVQVLDATTMLPIANVTVGTGFGALDINRVTNRIYASNSMNGTVSEIDGVTHAVTNIVNGGRPEGAIVVNPRTNRIYVANTSTNDVSVIDGTTRGVIAVVPVGSTPDRLALNTASNRIYVASSSGKTVTIIDGASHQTLALNLGAGLTALAVDPVRNKTYVGAYDATGIWVIDGLARSYQQVPTSGSNGWLAVNPVNGKLYGSGGTSSTPTAMVMTPARDVFPNHRPGLASTVARAAPATLGFNVCCAFAPNDPPPFAGYYRVGDAQGAFTPAPIAGSSFTALSTALLPGLNFVTAFVVDAQGGDGHPGGGTPLTGAVAILPVVSTAPVFATPSPLAGALLGTAYSQAITAVGEQGALTYTVTDGALPAGLSLSPSGTISGTPTADGFFTFTITASDGSGGSSSRLYALTVGASNPAREAGISTRMQVLTGQNVLIGGFAIGGNGARKTVVVRARGPSLAAQGVANTLFNPMLQLYAASGQIASNDDWQSSTNAATIEASGFAPPDASESAILMTLDSGLYTAIVTGGSGATGVGIVEVFEVDHPEVPLAAISTRGLVQTGDNVMIGGFVITGTVPQTVVVRGRGPSLASQGVASPLQNPTLTLVGEGISITNDDWGTAANAGQLQASGFAPADSREAAILVTLNPGAYTAIVSGVGGTSGVGIVEVFAQ